MIYNNLRNPFVVVKNIPEALFCDRNAGVRATLNILLPTRFEAVETVGTPKVLISTVRSDRHQTVFALIFP